MNNPQIVDYIRTELRRGSTKASIVSSMSAGGWNVADIESAFTEASKDFKQMEKSESFAPIIKKERYIVRKTIKVIILITIILLTFFFIVGESTLPPL